MEAESLAQVADELYGLVPAEFTAAREERSRQARAAGQRETGAEIKKLPRPTAGAWLVNQLVRAVPAQMDQLFEIGQSLQDAQRALDGDRLRELAGQRRQIIAELVPEAARLAAAAGQPASAAVLGEVRTTLEAALADPAAGEAVRSGRLARALTYAGLGEVDPTAAMAGPPPTAGAGRTGSAAAASARAAGQPRGREAAGEGADAKAARAREAVTEAEAAVQAATAAAAEAEARVGNLVEQRQFLRRRVEHLQSELDQATSEGAQLARDAKQAQRDQDIAARKLTAAQRQLAKARERAGSG